MELLWQFTFKCQSTMLVKILKRCSIQNLEGLRRLHENLNRCGQCYLQTLFFINSIIIINSISNLLYVAKWIVDIITSQKVSWSHNIQYFMEKSSNRCNYFYFFCDICIIWCLVKLYGENTGTGPGQEYTSSENTTVFTNLIFWGELLIKLDI